MCTYVGMEKHKHIHYSTHKPLEHACGPCRMKVVLDILQYNKNAKTCRGIIIIIINKLQLNIRYCSKVTLHSLAISMLEPRMLAALVSPY